MISKRIAWTLSVVLLLAGILTISCGDDQSDSAVLTADQIDELWRISLDASFAATYDAEMPDGDGRPQRVDLAINKAGPLMRIEMRFSEIVDLRVYATMDLREQADGIACGVRTLDSGEQVCLVEDDQAWTLVFAPLAPIVLLIDEFGLPGAAEVSSVGDRSIARLEARCYELAGDDLADGVEFCVGSNGEPLQQSYSFGGSPASFTATSVQHEVTKDDVEIPLPIVHEADLSAADCESLDLQCLHLDR
ncbi:MAG: hypothetical protein WEB52_06960 [Dehalococcoidia bacterium]